MAARAGLDVARRLGCGVVADIDIPFYVWMRYPGVVIPGPRRRTADAE